MGFVREINYDYNKTGKITVLVSLEDNMRINKGSYISILNTFLSGAELHIHLNSFVDDYYRSGDTIEGRMDSDMMTSVQESLLHSVEKLLPKIDSILGGLQTLVNHPALVRSLEHVEHTTSSLEHSSRQLDLLLAKDMPRIVDNLKNITDNFSAVSSQMRDIDLEGTMRSVNETLSNLKLTTEKLNSSDNSLGLLLNDRQFYDNLNGTMENASLLLLDLREHPKRYVHFSIFGKKDK